MLVYNSLVFGSLVYDSLVFGSLVFDMLVYDSLMYDSLVYDSLVFGSLVYDMLVYDSLVYDSLVYDSLVYDCLVFDSLVYDSLLYDSLVFEVWCMIICYIAVLWSNEKRTTHLLFVHTPLHWWPQGPSSEGSQALSSGYWRCRLSAGVYWRRSRPAWCFLEDPAIHWQLGNKITWWLILSVMHTFDVSLAFSRLYMK